MGFVVGVDGIKAVLIGCLTDAWFVAGTMLVCYAAVQIMFEIRNCEERETMPCKHGLIKEPLVTATVPINVSTRESNQTLSSGRVDGTQVNEE